jgi:hypothetical protein
MDDTDARCIAASVKSLHASALFASDVRRSAVCLGVKRENDWPII